MINGNNKSMTLMLNKQRKSDLRFIQIKTNIYASFYIIYLFGFIVSEI